MQKATRSVTQYGLDAFRVETPIDYQEGLELLAGLDPRERVIRSEMKAVALEHVKQVKRGRWHLVFVRGTHDEVPVLLNAASGRSEIQELEENQFIAYRTHMVVSLKGDRRTVLLEYSHYGAKASEIEPLLATLLEQATGSPHTVSLKPRFEASFAREAKRLTRIVEASATIAVPNPGWDDADGLLAELGQKSEAGRIGIHANARHGDSLSKQDGLVREIVDQSKGNGGIIEAAYLVGRRPGEDKDVRISLLNFVKKVALSVRRAGRTGVDSNDLLARMDEHATYAEEENDT